VKEAIESVQKYNSKLHNGFSFKLGRRRVECGDLSDWRVH
jgi:hypothetical protein